MNMITVVSILEIFEFILRYYLFRTIFNSKRGRCKLLKKLSMNGFCCC